MNMAILSTLLGNESIYPDSLRERLKGFPIFENVGEAALKRVLSESDWFSLPGGTVLERAGENDRAVFLVVAGCLGVFVEDEDGRQRLVAHVPAGETVGEMSLLTGEPHSAQIMALRDTEVLRLDESDFEKLISRYPRVVLNLTRLIVRRLRETTRSTAPRTRPRTFAVIPMQEGLENEPIARRIAEALVAMGSKAAVLDAMASEESSDWFNRFEAAHDVVFYQGDVPESAWTQLCLRQADRVLLIARSDRPLRLQRVAAPGGKARIAALPELLIIHPSGDRSGLPKHTEMKGRFYDTHHHVREDNPEDVRRLARFIAGRAVGLVLAGGGARGFAHIGVVKALHEAGVPFDHVGGTSMGGIIAAGLALEWSIEEMTARVRASFVDVNPLSDYTLPLIALVRGRKVTNLLRHHFGEVQIEDLPRPYFCVSSDLTSGRVHVHRTGPLWRALRASVALPGILPPVTHHGHLLVDGGVMNNLPVDVMAEDSRGPIIASDVTGELDLRAEDPAYGERPIWSLLLQRMRGSPSIVSILMRSGTVGNELQRRLARQQSDFLFEPPLEDIGLRDWKAFDRAIAEGYAHAALMIEQHGVPLSEVWSEGPAVSVMHMTGPSRTGSASN